VAGVVSGADPHTKSELGAVATSRTLSNPKSWSAYLSEYHELTLGLVATAPSSDFALSDNFNALVRIRIWCKAVGHDSDKL
jgi:hypothetical protein